MRCAELARKTSDEVVRNRKWEVTNSELDYLKPKVGHCEMERTASGLRIPNNVLLNAVKNHTFPKNADIRLKIHPYKYTDLLDDRMWLEEQMQYECGYNDPRQEQ